MGLAAAVALCLQFTLTGLSGLGAELASLTGRHALGALVERAFFFNWLLAVDAAPPEDVERLTISTPDGLALDGWFLRPAAPADRPPAVLYLHGSMGSIGIHEGFARYFTSRGFAVLLFDYRSYGLSDKGWLDREATLTDARAALDALAARDDVDTGQIAVVGHSMGGALAVCLAAGDERVRAVGLHSPFDSWAGLGRSYAAHAAADQPWLGDLVGDLLDRGDDAADCIAGLRGRPVVMVHSREDSVVFWDHGRGLVDAASDAGVGIEFHEFEGDHHYGTEDAPWFAIADGLVGAMGVQAPAVEIDTEAIRDRIGWLTWGARSPTPRELIARLAAELAGTASRAD